VALRLLSLTGPLAESSPGPRRDAAGELLGRLKGDSVRRRYERPLIASLARALLGAEVSFRHRTRDLDATKIDWVGRLNSYGRLYTPITRLGGDLEVLIRKQRERPGDLTILEPQISSSLWAFAWIQLQLDAFVEEYGGIWLFSNTAVENDVANAIFHINRNPGINDHDISWLRIALRDIADRELVPFDAAIRADARGRAILTAWGRWCQSCRCPSIAVPERGCELHAVIAVCDDYLDDIDQELLGLLGQPIRDRLRDVPIETIADLIKRFGAVRERPGDLHRIDGSITPG
jgi:hypothetical protein